MVIKHNESDHVQGSGFKPSALLLSGGGSREHGVKNLRDDLTGVTLPEDYKVQSEAIKKVLLYTIADALDVTEEEEIWLNWKLSEIFDTLHGKEVLAMPLSARQELLKGNYTKLLENRRTHFKPARSNASLYNPNNMCASVNDWVENVVNIFNSSYNLSASDEVRIKTSLVIIFKNLGVGDKVNPRGSSYIPSDLKHKIFQKLTES